MQGVPITWVDAFADRPFSGNPAAVCRPERPPRAAWMQRLATEIGLSETAFVLPRGERFELRWFTPAVEVELCGHATLAAAHALWEEGVVDEDRPVFFDTRSGELVARREQERWIALDFPATPARETAAPVALAAALGVEPAWVGRTDQDDLVVVLDHADRVVGLEPDFRRLATLSARGIAVTAAVSSGEHDFVSRFFAPRVGIDEDPVTGSAHCALAPLWSERLGRGSLVGWQASPRGGTVRVRSEGGRVVLAGTAVTILRGTLEIEEESDG
ncbi:MAG: PhzF family phenazine biosynthesis protein [Gemmatimonadota bacterium]|nr:PhzF family phenazine biosynthesis protein [Gemmatimonadota bacterium]